MAREKSIFEKLDILPPTLFTGAIPVVLVSIGRVSIAARFVHMKLTASVAAKSDPKSTFFYSGEQQDVCDSVGVVPNLSMTWEVTG
jgi:hypothetical protein